MIESDMYNGEHSIGASFMIGRCLTSTAWGMAADRIGRKPVIVFGIISVLV